MRRREFFKLIFGAATALPLTARAQQGERMRRIGLLMLQDEDDTSAQFRIAAFAEALQKLNWVTGRNIKIDIRWGAADSSRSRKYAAEMVALAPDVIVATASAATAALQDTTRIIPIVFVNVTDPVGAGYVASLARPGGNITGFVTFEYGIGGKWLEILKEIAPGVTRIAVLRDPTLSVGIGLFGAIQSAAPSLGLETSPVDVRDAKEIGRAIADFARKPNGGIVVAASPAALVNRTPIIDAAAKLGLPAVYFQKEFVQAGGLISYGPDVVAVYGHAATYVDRLLKGDKPADLPVQQPTKYETAVNLKTAKALNLAVPPSLLARADEVIE
jgi:putative ABC transport system substrate-binding protein